jgi:molybdate-binding protein/DNA-binding transcriptional regulator YhcF (GntR family)
VTDTDLYQRVAEDLRRRILTGELRPGDRVPTVRALSSHWGCTAATVQKAFKVLQDAGLIESQRGRGTSVAGSPHAGLEAARPLRQAGLVHRADTFLLQALTAGHSIGEVEAAFRVALDRWRAVSASEAIAPEHVIRFVGSHDLAVAWLASRFPELVPGYRLDVSFTGSLGGLIALAEGKADIAGSHLLDEESGRYNDGYVQRLFPGRQVALITLAHRRLGLVVPPGNPRGLTGIQDLVDRRIGFVNRQKGSGTRVWLDVELRRMGMHGGRIAGYEREVATHSAVAAWVAEGRAEAGLGLEGSAAVYGLGFVPLTVETYDLVTLHPEAPGISSLVDWLTTADGPDAIGALDGYEADVTGELRWIG